jgi:hypothetical protein
MLVEHSTQSIICDDDATNGLLLLFFNTVHVVAADGCMCS